MKPNAITKLVPKPTGGLIFWTGWKNRGAR